MRKLVSVATRRLTITHAAVPPVIMDIHAFSQNKTGEKV